LGYEPAAVTPAEVKLARQLIEHLSAKRFDPNEFADEHKVRVMQEIKKKIQSKQISLGETPTERPRDNVSSIMDALKASIRDKSGGRTGGKAAKKAVPTKSLRKLARA
jgi:non-homologous end joining protein Ku